MVAEVGGKAGGKTQGYSNRTQINLSWRQSLYMRLTGALFSIPSPPGESCDINLSEKSLTVESLRQIPTQIPSLRLAPSWAVSNLLRNLAQVALL
jgi:hypothetical protein